MSLFRKPKKIQRRVFCADDDEDVDGEPEPPPPPVISLKQKKEEKSVKAPKLLSFADEEEECEEFKVKKSSQSKRLAKRREKERRKVPDNDDNTFDKDIEFPEDNIINHAETEEKEKAKPKKKITLEGLILSGREALAADGAGDLSASEEEAEPEEAERGFHKYRAESVRAALAVAPGLIPDAALIHAARKTRQQARELGEFVPLPVDGGGGEGGGGGGRLVREGGEGDDSGDDDEGRILVRGLDLPSDKPKRGTAAIPSDEEIDSEAEEWEEQQMQKAMPALTDIADGIEVNPFSAAPPPPRAPPSAPHLRALDPPPTTATELVLAWRNRLAELRQARSRTRSARAQLAARADGARAALRQRAARRAALERGYRRAQARRGYLTDLVECLDGKLPRLEALERRALAAARRRVAFLVERRRADLRDQAQDTLAALARPGSARPPDGEEKIRRTAEREGRRRARRLRREAGGAAGHRDGDSSDDSLPSAEAAHRDRERESIRAAAAALFADTLPAYGTLRGVAARLARWRRRDAASYADCHAPAALPKLLAVYVRHQLILWNPLADEDNEDYEKMDWYKCLMMYGVDGGERAEGDSSSSSEAESDEREARPAGATLTERGVRDDVDLMLVPAVLNKVVLPKITELVECAWDPMCVRACVRLRAAVVRAAAVPRARAALARLGRAARAVLADALAHDAFLPTLPAGAAGAEGAGAAFWRRCAGAGVRLLRGALALTAPPRPLDTDACVLRLLEALCVAAGAAPGPQAALAADALAQTLPRAGALRARALTRLAALARRAQEGLDADNALHLKALEQTRAIIAEAKAAEAAS